MLDLMDDLLSNELVVALVGAVAVALTIYAMAAPHFDRQSLERRLRAVAVDREAMRTQERSLNTDATKRLAVRMRPSGFLSDIVAQFSLEKLFLDAGTRRRLVMAGYRGDGPLFVFLSARFMMPLLMLAASTLWLFGVESYGQDGLNRALICLSLSIFGTYLPVLYLKNQIVRRQHTIRRAFPDALDMLLICVESGMPVDAAIKRVADEIGMSSVPLAQELTLTSAELSFLQDRRLAFEHFANRTGLDEVKALVLALQQAEKYGTSIGATLRVLAKDMRATRMAEAEKKAASLPPKLTVPMIVFFLPVLMVIILTPAYILAKASFGH